MFAASISVPAFVVKTGLDSCQSAAAANRVGGLYRMVSLQCVDTACR